MIKRVVWIVLTILTYDIFATPAVSEPSISDLLTKNPKVIKTAPMISNGYKDKFNRQTPLGSLQALGEALDVGDYKHALNFLDIRNLPRRLRNQKLELIRQLDIVIRRSLWIDIATISTNPRGHKKDGLPIHLDKIAELKTPEGDVNIMIQRVPNKEGKLIWKVSSATIKNIPKLYKYFGYGKYGDKLSAFFPDIELLGMNLWQWVLLIFIIFIAYVIAWVSCTCLIMLVRLFKVKSMTSSKAFINGPTKYLLTILIIRKNFYLIAPTLGTKAIFSSNTFLTITVFWFLNGVVDFILSRMIIKMQASQKHHLAVLMRPCGRFIKIIFFFIAIMIWFDNLGINVSTLLAGLGIGGIAIGLAAQKSIENLIGSFTLFLARPVAVGDLCRVGTTFGRVEEIGLRSTSIRTLERTIVIIPNATFANLEIENLNFRDKMLFRKSVHLQNDTGPENVKEILKQIKEMMLGLDYVDPDPARIRFTDFAQSSFKLDIFTYIKTTDMSEYLAMTEEINLNIITIIANCGGKIAIPKRGLQIDANLFDQLGTLKSSSCNDTMVTPAN